MSQKRQEPEEGTSFDDRHPRNAKSFKSVVREVMNLCKLQHLMEPVLEPLIRRVVKEEVDSALRKYIINTKRNYGKDTHPSEPRNLCLQFSNGISLPVFTGTRIEGEGSTRMEVALVDILTGEVVFSGHGSSEKVEIVVLEGDFDGDERGNWTAVEFQNNTVRERDGKKPLLTGDLIMTLQDGKGLVGNIMFTDNSSWTRSRKFRLGAKLLDSISGVRVREARSEPFVVRDHRGELYKKHHPPSLSDEVWRLEKIGKGGAFHKRLRKERITTVEDFLVSFFLDPTRLRNILGTGMSAKMWEVVVEHARTCVIDQKLQFYGTSQDNGVVFDMVGQLMGIISNGQYLRADKLSEAEKAEAHESVISAFADRDKIVSFDEGSSPNFPTPSSLSVARSSSNLPSETSFNDDEPYLQHNAASPTYMESVYSLEGLGTFEDCLHQVEDNLICNADTLNRALCADELQYFETDQAIHSPLLELSGDIQGDISAYMPYSGVPTGKSERGWNILVFVLRWWFSIRRIVARKTRT
ncbi:calmodulin-binding protein 60 A-like isoform X1 [Salvia hispanica]|uniref:calmodulin-binding protein 60 A-like isoform X1 n=2 Tax=Salvia hispanica TaxID=49212 RepID=UPI0020093548|nr:calmodulin-binding protein 60 A-like isoform X1 [Salvia hispanica]XP_047982483.1 calmodulin-binding protein 60 A-like isoform X1 [Salvia hispanica]